MVNRYERRIQLICILILPAVSTTGQGFGCIRGLEEYTGCKVLHLENNCLKSVEGLGHMTQLRWARMHA